MENYKNKWRNWNNMSASKNYIVIFSIYQGKMLKIDKEIGFSDKIVNISA